MANMESYYRSVLEADRAPVVLCDLDHTIMDMYPAAKKRYTRFGGAALLGKCLLDCHNEASCGSILKVVEWFREAAGNNLVHTFYNQKENKDVYMVALRDEQGSRIGYYEKQEYRDRETMKPYEMP